MPVAVDFRALALPQHRLAKLFGVGPRSVRRWQAGDRRLPVGVDILVRLLVARVITVEQLEQAATTNPVRTNGSGKPDPHLTEPTAIALAVLALEPGRCRWPIGDPKDSNFRFCCNPVTEPPYCACHCSLAYLPALPRGRAQTALTAWGRAKKPAKSEEKQRDRDCQQQTNPVPSQAKFLNEIKGRSPAADSLADQIPAR